ncbi:hypothetical protein EJ03DRAFT_55788 [Teratosphaeria nubilosa]|uniref:Uncharacterized protein n=1 Tax=Teratosphaeria nubilosa TaxID=161662 RepID=A0A6G1LD75_9PEZI|nr:hypothetical protein EJ03DRAFT_55788 [Teratosphaeria nubilosa]
MWQEDEEIQGTAFRMPEATDVSTLQYLPTEAVDMYRAPRGSIALFVVRGKLAGDPECHDPEPAERPLSPTDPPGQDWYELGSKVIRWEWFEDLRSENGIPIVFLFVNVASHDLGKLGLTPLPDGRENQQVTQQQRQEKVEMRSRKRARYHSDRSPEASRAGRGRFNQYCKRDAEEDESDEDDYVDEEEKYEDDEAEASHAHVSRTSLNLLRKPERRSGKQSGQETKSRVAKVIQQKATPAPSVSSPARPTGCKAPPRRTTSKTRSDVANYPPAPAFTQKPSSATSPPGRPTFKKAARHQTRGRRSGLYHH